VLTGDKIETAINIGMSAKLLDTNEYMDQHLCDEVEPEKLHNKLGDILKDVKKNKGNLVQRTKKQALVIAGASLIIIDEDEGLK